MAIPFILLGAATLAGAFGVKNGIDAKSVFKSSKTATLQAQNRYESAAKELAETINTTQIAFDVLGNKKIEMYTNSLIPFVEAFSMIKNVDFKDGRIFEETSLSVTQADMLTLLDVSLKMKDIMTTGVGCLGGGGLTVLAASGVNGLLGGVSAGSVFGSASGAAATNSAIACIGGGGGMAAAGACAGGGAMVGGGTMAGAGCMAGAAGGMAGVAGGMAGGMGMGMGAGAGAGAMAGAAGGMGMGGGAGAMAGGAGGMGMCGGSGALAGAGGTAGGVGGGGVVSAVTGGVTGGTVAGMASLGGMIAGPFLAVGGMVLASKAKKAKVDAATNIERVNAAVEQMKSQQVAPKAAFYRTYTIISVLCRLEERFASLLTEVQALVVASNDYSSYDDKDKKVVMMAAMLAKTTKNVMETQLLDDNGIITSASEQIVEESEHLMQVLAI